MSVYRTLTQDDIAGSRSGRPIWLTGDWETDCTTTGMGEMGPSVAFRIKCEMIDDISITSKIGCIIWDVTECEKLYLNPITSWAVSPLALQVFE